jgi:predicted AAA+ superfamily ATPase
LPSFSSSCVTARHWCLQSLLKYRKVLYWRTASGEEVDFVIETPARTIPIEVKAATRVSAGDARGLESFLEEYADAGLQAWRS